MPSPKDLKSQLRKSKILQRDSLCGAYRQQASKIVATSLLNLLNELPHNELAIFYSIKSEIHILSEVTAWGLSLSLPCIEAKNSPLVFRRWNGNIHELETKPFGLLEPSKEAEIVIPDILIVPLLAFDSTGVRLGYGGGYYDRSIAEIRALKNVVTIGIGFEIQKEAEIPQDVFDMKLDYVITEARIYEFNES